MNTFWYWTAERKLKEIREHNGEDSPEEDEHLDKMDLLWDNLTEEEKEEINKLGEAGSPA